MIQFPFSAKDENPKKAGKYGKVRQGETRQRQGHGFVIVSHYISSLSFQNTQEGRLGVPLPTRNSLEESVKLARKQERPIEGSQTCIHSCGQLEVVCLRTLMIKGLSLVQYPPIHLGSRDYIETLRTKALLSFGAHPAVLSEQLRR